MTFDTYIESVKSFTPSGEALRASPVAERLQRVALAQFAFKASGDAFLDRMDAKARLKREMRCPCSHCKVVR